MSGASGLASGNKKKDDEAKPEEKKEDQPKKKGFGLSSITASKQNQSNQQVASAGARGVGIPDRDAKGGSDPAPINVKVTAADLEAFKKGIAG